MQLPTKGSSQLDRIALFGDLGRELRNRPIQVGRVRPDDVRLQRAEIDFDHPIVVALGINLDLAVGPQAIGDSFGQRSDIVAIGGPQIGCHTLVEGEHRGRRAQLGAHVADRSLAGGADRARAGAKILDDAAGAALDGQNARQLEDHILRRGPAVEFPRQLDADHAWPAQLPRHAYHHIDGVSAANADGDHAQAAGIGGVAVGADHHTAREGVVLQHHLVDDARTRLPKTHAIALTCAQQEIIDFLVFLDCDRQIALDAELGANRGGRHGSCWALPCRRDRPA